MMKQAPTSTRKKDSRISGLLKKSAFKPPELNALVDEVFYMTQGGSFNVRILSERVKEDLALTEQILKICSLPYYSGKTHIRSMSQVIQRLGPFGFQAVLMEAFLDREIYSEGVWEKELQPIRTYSLIVGHLCRIISRYSSVNQDTAFLCGLLHRIGFAAGLSQFDDMEQGFEEIWHTMEVSHTVFGRMTLVEWGLDEEVQDVVANYGQVVINGKVNLLSATILVAEEIARRFKFGVRQSKFARREGLSTKLNDDIKHAVKLLELDDETLKIIYMESYEVLGKGLKLAVP